MPNQNAERLESAGSALEKFGGEMGNQGGFQGAELGAGGISPPSLRSKSPPNTRQSGLQLHHSYILLDLDIKIWKVGPPASRAGLYFLKVHKSASRTEALRQPETIIYGLETCFRCTGSLRAEWMKLSIQT